MEQLWRLLDSDGDELISWAEWDEAFNLVDFDQSDSISRKEFSVAGGDASIFDCFERKRRFHLSRAEWQKVFISIDRNRDSMITSEEFRRYINAYTDPPCSSCRTSRGDGKDRPRTGSPAPERLRAGSPAPWGARPQTARPQSTCPAAPPAKTRPTSIGRAIKQQNMDQRNWKVGFLDGARNLGAKRQGMIDLTHMRIGVTGQVAFIPGTMEFSDRGLATDIIDRLALAVVSVKGIHISITGRGSDGRLAQSRADRVSDRLLDRVRELDPGATGWSITTEGLSESPGLAGESGAGSVEIGISSSGGHLSLQMPPNEKLSPEVQREIARLACDVDAVGPPSRGKGHLVCMLGDDKQHLQEEKATMENQELEQYKRLAEEELSVTVNGMRDEFDDELRRERQKWEEDSESRVAKLVESRLAEKCVVIREAIVADFYGQLQEEKASKDRQLQELVEERARRQQLEHAGADLDALHRGLEEERAARHEERAAMEQRIQAMQEAHQAMQEEERAARHEERVAMEQRIQAVQEEYETKLRQTEPEMELSPSEVQDDPRPQLRRARTDSVMVAGKKNNTLQEVKEDAQEELLETLRKRLARFEEVEEEEALPAEVAPANEQNTELPPPEPQEGEAVVADSSAKAGISSRALAAACKLQHSQAASAAFRHLDSDESGHLGQQELRKFFLKSGVKADTDEEMDKAIEQLMKAWGPMSKEKFLQLTKTTSDTGKFVASTKGLRKLGSLQSRTAKANGSLRA